MDTLGGYCFCLDSFTAKSSRNRLRFLQRNQSFFREGKCKGLGLLKDGVSNFSSRGFSAVNGRLVDEYAEVNLFDRPKLNVLPPIQTLREFPKEELFGKAVMVRCNSELLHLRREENQFLSSAALSTIKYLHEAGAKVVIVSSWNPESNSKFLSVEAFAEFLSSILEVKVVAVDFLSRTVFSKVEGKEESCIYLFDNLFHFKEEPANCKEFAESLASGVDIFVNDDFSCCHKVLASTVGVARFCYACISGFCFEEGLWQRKKIAVTNKRPYVAIIGGGNFVTKAAALKYLAGICDGLVFVGKMAFQIMHAQGLPVPTNLLEPDAFNEALAVVDLIRSRGIPIVLPTDFLCLNNTEPEQLDVCSSDCLLEGWQPVDLGPKSLEEITSLLSKCKKILWICPAKFDLSTKNVGEASKLVAVLQNLKQKNLDIIVVGRMASALLTGMHYAFAHDAVGSGSVVWEFLKGRSLPGIMALDRVHFCLSELVVLNCFCCLNVFSCLLFSFSVLSFEFVSIAFPLRPIMELNLYPDFAQRCLISCTKH